jgi:hypothetical protein
MKIKLSAAKEVEWLQLLWRNASQVKETGGSVAISDRGEAPFGDDRNVWYKESGRGRSKGGANADKAWYLLSKGKTSRPGREK